MLKFKNNAIIILVLVKITISAVIFEFKHSNAKLYLHGNTEIINFQVFILKNQ